MIDEQPGKSIQQGQSFQFREVFQCENKVSARLRLLLSPKLFQQSKITATLVPYLIKGDLKFSDNPNERSAVFFSLERGPKLILKTFLFICINHLNNFRWVQI